MVCEYRDVFVNHVILDRLSAGFELVEADLGNGLSSEDIESLGRKTQVVEGECPICVGSVKDCKVMVIDCSCKGKEYHEECAVPWLSLSGTCPTCRHKILRMA